MCLNEGEERQTIIKSNQRYETESALQVEEYVLHFTERQIIVTAEYYVKHNRLS